jgi:hypothetical protein
VSYDLFFCVPGGRGSLSQADFQAYFQGRPHYVCRETQAWYENEYTGVYFSFEYDADLDPELLEIIRNKGKKFANVLFNINFNRPHVFALEAEPEIAALVSRFELLVEAVDETMADGRYIGQEFIEGWNFGNGFSYEAARQTGTLDRALANALPTATIEHWWRWNRQREKLEAEFEESDIFLPRISAFSPPHGILPFRREVGLKTAVLWPDAISIAVPEVDYFLLGHDKGDNRWDMRLVRWDDASVLLSKGSRIPAEPEYLLFSHTQPPQEFWRVFDRGRQIGSPPEWVPFEQVLNLELLRSR